MAWEPKLLGEGGGGELIYTKHNYDHVRGKMGWRINRVHTKIMLHAPHALQNAIEGKVLAVLLDDQCICLLLEVLTLAKGKSTCDTSTTILNHEKMELLK